jgi:hypothetical protein
VLEFRPTNPLRPPDWRWKYGKQLAEAQAPKTRAGRHVGLVRKFNMVLLECQSETDHLQLVDEWPDLYEAWRIYSNEQAKSARWEIEARLLAGQPFEAIAKLTRVSPEILTLYEKVFFDVLDKLDAPSYIVHTVLFESFNRGVSEKHHDILWKMFGYWAGPHVLDFLIFKFNRPQKADASSTSVNAFLADDIRGQQLLKASLAMRTMPVNFQTQIEIINLYYRMIEMERESEGASGGSQEMFTASVKSFLGAVPWTSAMVRPSGNVVVSQADQQAAALRASELVTIGGGQVPPGLEAILASARFPEPPKPPAIAGPVQGGN